MSQPRPESRIQSLENRMSTVEATLIELSSDTAEELKAIRQDIKQGHLEIGEAIDSHANVLTQKLTAIESAMATKDDISTLKTDISAIETRLSKIEATQTEQGSKLDQVLQLLQQKPGQGPS